MKGVTENEENKTNKNILRRKGNGMKNFKVTEDV